jgi:hypothetical protein
VDLPDNLFVDGFRCRGMNDDVHIGLFVIF